MHHPATSARLAHKNFIHHFGLVVRSILSLIPILDANEFSCGTAILMSHFVHGGDDGEGCLQLVLVLELDPIRVFVHLLNEILHGARKLGTFLSLVSLVPEFEKMSKSSLLNVEAQRIKGVHANPTLRTLWSF